MNPEPLNTNHGTILVVDDETSVRRVLSATLSGLGFTVIAASRGQEAVELAKVAQFDAVLLDVDMPGVGGVEACRSIRSSNAFLPILMLTAMDSEDDQVAGLEAGADDYITKPFAMRELVARLRSAVRRRKTQDTHQDSPKQEAVIRYGEIELDPLKYRLLKRGQRIHLTPKQFAMLHCLMIHAGEVVSQEQLLKFAWGPDYGDESTYLRVYMCQLRKKIEDDPLYPEYLITVAHVGYRFNKLRPEPGRVL
jgi:two-component system, OmpR family, KDP operon response regulator KdpE